MTSRKLLPYWLTIVLFTGLYLLTMILPDATLGLHSREGWSSTGRIPMQAHIFIGGLMGVLLIINLLETFSSRDDNFLVRFLKSIMTILLSYAAGAVVFFMLHTKVWNMYYAVNGVPARVFLFTTIMCTMVALVTINILKALVGQMIAPRSLGRFIPAWLSFESEEEA